MKRQYPEEYGRDEMSPNYSKKGMSSTANDASGSGIEKMDQDRMSPDYPKKRMSSTANDASGSGIEKMEQDRMPPDYAKKGMSSTANGASGSGIEKMDQCRMSPDCAGVSTDVPANNENTPEIEDSDEGSDPDFPEAQVIISSTGAEISDIIKIDRNILPPDHKGIKLVFDDDEKFFDLENLDQNGIPRELADLNVIIRTHNLKVTNYENIDLDHLMPDHEGIKITFTTDIPEVSDTENIDQNRMSPDKEYTDIKLGIMLMTDEHSQYSMLGSLSLDGIAAHIKEGGTKILTFVGAGISTDAGIPDFDSEDGGIFCESGIKDFETLFYSENYIRNPRPFFNLIRKFTPRCLLPTLTHYFIRLLNEKGLLLRHYTLNVDTLDRLAGIPEDKIVECYGTLATSHCIKCNEAYDLHWLRKKLYSYKLIPNCEKCSEGVVKPDITLFGEKMATRYYTMVDQDFPNADLLIVIGTSLRTIELQKIINYVSPYCPRLLINRKMIHLQSEGKDGQGILKGFDFSRDQPDGKRDVAWIGDCQIGIEKLADKLGFGDELRNLHKLEHCRLLNSDASAPFSNLSEEPMTS